MSAKNNEAIVNYNDLSQYDDTLIDCVFLSSDDSFTSICEVITPDKDNRPRIKRLADVKAGGLVIPFIPDDSIPKFYGNRALLIYVEGPKEIGKLGVWDWTTGPNRNDSSRSHEKTYFRKDVHPVSVVPFSDCDSVTKLIKKLQKGVDVELLSPRTLFTTKIDANSCYGVIFDKDVMDIRTNIVKINESVNNLLIYKVSPDNILELSDGLFVYKYLFIGVPDRVESLKNPVMVAHQIIKNRATWKAFSNIVKSKSEWKHIRDFLEQIDVNSVYDEISRECYCSLKEAEDIYTRYLECINAFIDGTTIEDKWLLAIISRNEELLERCKNLVAVEWEAEVGELLSKKNSELKELDEKTSAARSEYEKYESELNALKDKIDSQKELSSSLETELGKQIDDVQKNAAKFIAQMSLYSACNKDDKADSDEVSAKVSSILSPSVFLKTDDMEVCDDWKAVIATISDELVLAGVNSKYSEGFASYLYSAELNRVPLLLAGPNAIEIVNAYTAARYGRLSAFVDCNLSYDHSVERSLLEIKEPIITLVNALNTEWINRIPTLIKKAQSYCFVVHSYADDLVLEPRDIFYYMLPVYTDLLVDKSADSNFWAGMESDGFKPFVSEGVNWNVPSKITKQLRIPPIITTNFNRILSDVDVMTEESTLDVAVLCSLIPFARATGNLSEMLTLIENKSEKLGTSNEIKQYVFSFFGESL